MDKNVLSKDITTDNKINVVQIKNIICTHEPSPLQTIDQLNQETETHPTTYMLNPTTVTATVDSSLSFNVDVDLIIMPEGHSLIASWLDLNAIPHALIRNLTDNELFVIRTSFKDTASTITVPYEVTKFELCHSPDSSGFSNSNTYKKTSNSTPLTVEVDPVVERFEKVLWNSWTLKRYVVIDLIAPVDAKLWSINTTPRGMGHVYLGGSVVSKLCIPMDIDVHAIKPTGLTLR